MKHFRKPLIVILVFAMVLAAAVITVIATDDTPTYTGSVNEARAALQAAKNETDEIKKSEALAAFYKYTQDTPIDPTATGYGELMAEYNALTFDIAKSLMKKAVDATTNNNKSNELAQVWNHVTGAPITDTAIEGYADFVKSYTGSTFGVFKAFVESSDLAGAYANITAAPIIDYVVSAETGALFSASTEYVEAVSAYNTAAFAAFRDSLSAYDSASDKTEALGTVYAIYVSSPVLDPAMEGYSALLADYDAKGISFLNSLVEAVGATDSLSEKIAHAKAIYAHIAAAPILNTASQEYSATYAAYNAAAYDVAKLCYADLLDEKTALDVAIEDCVDFLASVPALIYKEPAVSEEFTGTLEAFSAYVNAYYAEGADKFAVFSELFNYILKNPVDPESGAPVVNEEGKPVDKNGVPLPEGATDFYLEAEKLYDSFAVIYGEIYTALNEMLDNLDASASMVAPEVEEGAPAELSDFAKHVKTLANLAVYLDKTPVSEYFYDKYNEQLSAFVDRLKSEVDAKYTAYGTLESVLNSYLSSISVDAAVLPENNGYEAFVLDTEALKAYAIRKSVIDLLYDAEESKFKLIEVVKNLINVPVLEFEEPKTPEIYSGSIEAVQALLIDYRTSVSLEDKTRVYRDIYNYMKETPINPFTDGYEAFLGAYKSAGEEIYVALINEINSATDNAKLEKLDEMRSYITDVPISNAAYNAYNLKLFELYESAVATALADYNVKTSALHEKLAEDGVEEAIGVKVVLPEPDEDEELLSEIAEVAVSKFAGAIDNVEIVETWALALIYKYTYLNDNLAENYLAMFVRSGAYKKLNSYVKKHGVAETTLGYANLMIEVNAAREDYADKVALAKKLLDAEAPLAEHELNGGYTYKQDFNDGKSMTFTGADKGPGGATGTYAQIIDRDEGGKALELVYGSYASAYIQPAGLNTSLGLVMEFDLSTDKVIKQLNFFTNANGHTTGAKVTTQLMRILNNKVHPMNNGAQQGAIFGGQEIIVPGEWTHFTLIYNPEGPSMKLYIDYEFAAEWGVKNAADTYTLNMVRIRAGVTDTVIRFDEFDFYQGTAYRDRETFEGMTNEEKFAYFVEQACNEGRNTTDRLYAYENANMLLAACDESLIEEHLEKFNAIDVENDIKIYAKLANLNTLISYCDEIKALGSITTSTVAEASSIVEKIETFISNNSANLEQSSDEFNAVAEYVEEIRASIARVDLLSEFISALKRFERATTLAAKTKHYEAARLCYENGEFHLDSVRELLVSDPGYIGFEVLINGGIESDSPEYITVFEYYETALASIGTQEMWENSKRIIDCMRFVLELESYEDTEEFWNANYEFIERYVNIVRDVLKSGNYSAVYPDLDKTIEKYNVINEYFYEKLQEEHIAAIGPQLEKYPTTNSYIEKLGICTFVENYVASNDIDMTNETLNSYILMTEVYKKELVVHQREYAALLEQNTVYFIGLVNKMVSYVNYNDIKPLYDEASAYYYEMNVDSDEAKLAIARFEECGAKLASEETASAMFLGYVSDIKKAKNDEALYLALVNATKYLDGVSEGIDGVADAIEVYEEKLAAYNAKIAPMNSDLGQINDVVGAVRTGSISSAILAVINRIFNR